MKLSDSPHAVGTPEHGQWVRTVFIPSVSAERYVTDAAIAGAQSIGRNLLHAGRRITYTLDIDTSGLKRALEELMAAFNDIRPVFERLWAAMGDDSTRSVIASQRRRRHR